MFILTDLVCRGKAAPLDPVSQGRERRPEGLAGQNEADGHC